MQLPGFALKTHISACGPGLGWICQQCWSVPTLLEAAAKKKCLEKKKLGGRIGTLL